MKKKSFIRSTVWMLMLQMILLVVILLVFLNYSYRSGEEDAALMLNNFLQIYGNELEDKIENGDRVLERLIYGNSDYDMLQSGNESDRYYASMNLHKLLQESIVNDSSIDMVVIAEGNYQTFLSADAARIPLSERKAIQEFSLECADENLMKARWNIKTIGETPYIYKMYVWHSRVAGIFLSVDSFMETAGNSELEEMTLLLTDDSGIIYGSYGSNPLSLQKGMTAEEMPGGKRIENSFELADGSLRIYSYMEAGNFAGRMKSSMVVILVIILLSLMSALVLVAYIRRDILTPMKQMKESMEQIQRGDYRHRITERYDNDEFSMLKDTFNQLMDEILGLKIKSYEKQIELQETELKAIRLQIRPHFFLNAMTTISSLSMQKKNDAIKTYIDALSKNIRYMFKSGLHTVPLAEEIRHVENYFEMQELKYPDCVFYYIAMEPGLEDWRIPQMLLHTVIENEYKYAVALDSLLTILIKISRTVSDGEEMLSIEIEDDGKGYPVEVLRQFTEEAENPGEDGNRVGLWSLRRMLEIMYERKNLFYICNIEPHGCLNRFLIPGEPVHEIRTAGEQAKID